MSSTLSTTDSTATLPTGSEEGQRPFSWGMRGLCPRSPFTFPPSLPGKGGQGG